MKFDAIKKYCAALQGATFDLKWGADHVYSVGGRMFAVTHQKADGRVSVSFKVDDARFLELTDQPYFIPAPYLARAKWVQADDTSKVPIAELKSLLSRSHQLIAARLTKKAQRELGLID